MSEAEHRVLVLGYGEIGHAVQHLLGPLHLLQFWDPYRRDLPALDLERAARSAEFLFYCVPATAHDELARRLAPLLRPETISASVSKGLAEDGRTPARVLADSLGEERGSYALIYGPMIAEEIMAGRFAYAQVGCASPEAYARLKALFAGSRLYLQQSSDIVGVSWAAVLKNVYAMLFGALDELELGDNVRGFLAATALDELDAIVIAMGGQAGTAYEMAGLGDLVATATSVRSHHYQLGRRLARGVTQDIGGEAVHALATIERQALFDLSRFRLCGLAMQILREPQQARSHFEHCLRTMYG